jgi:hypothetical protein
MQAKRCARVQSPQYGATQVGRAVTATPTQGDAPQE